MEDDEDPVLLLQHQKNIEMAIAFEGSPALPPVATQLSCNSICSFSKQANDNLESEERSKSVTKLSGLIIFLCSSHGSRKNWWP